ncbi:hypothetical protein NQ317_006862 [Molorchus minor]|uniref:Uncharacterized protein n=1 Tax=Molorchus minor TaxID=1323400 RepID=A0ABQ9K350_9CUCU|nr:hypothetical protein NQ317_006862 [Molorchus minor]
MSAPSKDPGEGPRRPPENPPSPQTKRLRDRVSFFEKVWTGTRSGTAGEDVNIDVEDFERKLAEERARHAGQSHVEHVTLRHTPTSSPKHAASGYVQDAEPDSSFQACTFIAFLVPLLLL